MKPINALIQEVRSETPSIRTYRLDLSLNPAPGQYAMVWVHGVDEIPMGFSGVDTITVNAVGDATRALFKLSAGSSLGIRGPLGNGFTLAGEKILLIGGGVGVAPLAYLGEAARDLGIEVESLIGFRTVEDMIFRSRFMQLGRVVLTTDDGSTGIHGRVSAGLSGLDLDSYSQIYLCGPEMMMWDVISRTKDHASRIQACINRYFKCGSGICGSCCLDPEGIRVCTEGPVIQADRLLDSEFGRYRRGPAGDRGPCRG
ncbi:MAG TPA: dihydroorotate dehydrogenase electron transfer subunit [Methanotrichaceae archaeon]|nr:dihydroorotate dehydrogenase electron transfer subunit [Methanotrichaceae archaeon]